MQSWSKSLLLNKPISSLHQLRRKPHQKVSLKQKSIGLPLTCNQDKNLCFFNKSISIYHQLRRRPHQRSLFSRSNENSFLEYKNPDLGNDNMQKKLGTNHTSEIEKLRISNPVASSNSLLFFTKEGAFFNGPQRFVPFLSFILFLWVELRVYTVWVRTVLFLMILFWFGNLYFWHLVVGLLLAGW